MKKAPFRLYGIYGYPLGHTLSPVFQEAAFAQEGLKAYYLTLELQKPAFLKVMRGLRRSVLDGFNITVPYKEAALRALPQVSREARVIGAVNTAYRKGRRWLGTNTDWSGFLHSLKQDAKFSPRGKRVVVLGAGGSSRAVVFALVKSKARSIHIANRHAARGEKLAKDLHKTFPKVRWSVSGLTPTALREAFKNADLVVNTTSVGLKASDRSLISGSMLPPRTKKRMLFYDLVYRPAETKMMKQVKKRGHRAVNGLGMLLYQGAQAFELWTGKRAPLSAMRRSLEKSPWK